MKKQEQFIYIWYLLVQCHHLTRKPAFIPKCHGEWRLRVNPQFTSQISGFCHIGNLISWNLALSTSGGFCFPLWPVLLISAAGHLGRQILLSLITKTGLYPSQNSTKTPSKQLSRTRSWPCERDVGKVLQKKPARTAEEAGKGEGHS